MNKNVFICCKIQFINDLMSLFLGDDDLIGLCLQKNYFKDELTT